VSLAITPDSYIIVTGLYGGEIKIWDFQTGRLVKSFTGHEKPVVLVAITRDGRNLVSGSKDGIFKIWDSETWQQKQVMNFFEPGKKRRLKLSDRKEFKCAVITANGDLAIAASNDNRLTVWDLHTGEIVYILADKMKGITSLALTSDDSHLISGASEQL